MESTTKMEIGEVFTLKDEIDVDPVATVTCKICKTEVPSSDFDQHVEEQHGLGAGDYPEVAVRLEDFFKDNDAGKSQAEASPGDQIENGCTFQCKLCDYTSGSWRTMTTHYRQEHRDEKRDPWGPNELVVTKKYYKCQECSRILLQDKRVIDTHMRSAHPARPHKPKKMAKKREKSTAKSSFRDTNSGTDQGEISTKVVKKEAKTTRKAKNIKKSSSNAVKAIERNIDEQNVVDGCRFRCKYCAHDTNSWTNMTKHIFRTHKSAPKKHDPMDLVVEKVSYQCKDCGKILLQDKRILNTHKALCGKTKKAVKEGTKATSKTPTMNQGVDIITKDATLKEDKKSADKTPGQTDGSASDLKNICKFRCQPCDMVFN